MRLKKLISDNFRSFNDDCYHGTLINCSCKYGNELFFISQTENAQQNILKTATTTTTAQNAGKQTKI